MSMAHRGGTVMAISYVAFKDPDRISWEYHVV